MESDVILLLNKYYEKFNSLTGKQKKEWAKFIFFNLPPMKTDRLLLELETWIIRNV